MDVKYDGLPEGEIKLVYVRPVAVAGLPDAVRAQIGPVETVYSVHGADGVQLALVSATAPPVRLVVLISRFSVVALAAVVNSCARPWP